MDDQTLDKKGVIKAMFFAILIALLSIGFLSWQYHRLEKEKLPALEEKLEEQAEKSSAEDVLEKFMQLRIDGNENRAMYYLTERAVEQKERGEFNLLGNIEDYDVLSSEKLSKDNYRFAIKTYKEGGLIDFVELIILIKVSDRYYVDSVEIAG